MRRFLPFILLFFLVSAWTFAFQQIPFFWDTVQLGSKHAHFFFDNNLTWQTLPVNLDSGHPPVFGYYLALAWTIGGKSLAVSHWAMFPFLLGMVWLAYAIGKHWAGAAWAWGLVALIFLDPVLAGQSVLVGPDIPLACFFLLAIWGLFSNKKYAVLLAIIGLCLISMRGMMTAAALFSWQIFRRWQAGHSFGDLLRQGLTFMPGFVLAALFLGWHYQKTGWIGFHPDSPWAEAFRPVDVRGFVKNTVVIGWRWLDFGRIFEWLLLVYLAIQIRTKSSRILLFKQGELFQLVLLFLCLCLFLSPSALLYHNLSAHRYFLPAFLCFHLLFFYTLVVEGLRKSLKRGVFVVAILGLASGNFWIYPTGVSMDWDATLAHLPYHQLRAEMLEFIEAHEIRFDQVGTAFPNLNSGENLLLNGDQRLFAEKDFSKNKYVLLSNVYNDFSKQDYLYLNQNWQLMHHLEQAGVWISLYQNPN